jgi:CRP-like cAMP-binding protein
MIIEGSLFSDSRYGVMPTKSRPSFDPKFFLAKVGEGRSIDRYHKDQIVFSQGDPADAVFYIERGEVKFTVVSEQGKEAVVAILGTNQFFGEGCLAGQAQRIATVATVTDSVIVRLEKAAIVRVHHRRQWPRHPATIVVRKSKRGSALQARDWGRTAFT